MSGAGTPHGSFRRLVTQENAQNLKIFPKVQESLLQKLKANRKSNHSLEVAR
jgi:hypothetical protein